MLLNYHIGRFVLSSLCVGDLVRLGLSSARVAGWSTSQISNTQRTENKTTDVVIQQHSRKLLLMDILMSETCWVHKKWNKIARDIKLVFYSSPIKFSAVYAGRSSITIFTRAHHTILFVWIPKHMLYTTINWFVHSHSCIRSTVIYVGVR